MASANRGGIFDVLVALVKPPAAQTLPLRQQLNVLGRFVACPAAGDRAVSCPRRESAASTVDTVARRSGWGVLLLRKPL